MKLKNLLILGALLLSGSASATIVDGVRQKPVPSFVDMQFDQVQYLYNVKAEKYWLGANDWSTQASVGDDGWKMKVYKHLDANGEWDNKTVTMQDSVQNGSYAGKWLKAWFVSGGNTMYTDHNGQADTLWVIQKVGGVYRLSASAENTATVAEYAANFVGVNLNAADTRLYYNLGEADTAQIDWQFVSSEAYAVHQEALGIYSVAQSLKASIEEAKGKGLSVSAQEAVYANEAATAAELEEALEAVKSALAEYEEANVDPNNPVDKTSLLANPDYTDGKVDWTDTNSDWAVSYNVAEHYDDIFDHYQVVKNLPKGVYAVTLRGYIRSASSATAWSDYNNGIDGQLKLYASTETDTLTAAVKNIWVGKSEAALGVGSTSTATDADGKVWYVTNNMEGAEAYFNDAELGPKYDVVLFFGVEGDSVQVGVKQDSLVGDDWALWDNWRLTYYGKRAEAYQMWIANAIANAPKFNGSEVITAGMVENYTATLNGLSASNNAEAVAAMNTISEGAAAIQANIEAWKDLQTAIDKCNALTTNNTIDHDHEAAIEAEIYPLMEGEDIVLAREYTTEQVVAEAAKAWNLYKEATRKALLPGSDVSEMYLTNYDFENTADGKSDGKGWEGSWGAFGGTSNNQCMEAYDITWDAYQTVEGAPAGIYEVSLQGFFRVQRGQSAWDLYLNGGQVCPGSVYLNNNATGIKCVFDEPVKWTENIYSGTTSDVEGNFCRFEDPLSPGDSLCTPNDMASAGEAFAAGLYQAAANGVVAQDGGELRIGVKGSLTGGTWAIWDNFKMVYWAKQMDKVKPHLETAIANAEANLAKKMDKSTRAMVETAKAEGEAAMKLEGKENEDAVFQALVNLYNLNDSVNASVALFEEVSEAASTLFELSAIYYDSPFTLEAQTMADNALSGVEGGELTNAEAKALLAEMDVMSVKLKVPVYDNASDANPVEFTRVLENPDFGDAQGTNAIDGWDGTSGYNFGNDDTQKGAMALEFYEKTFDMSQTVIAGLPNGTYRVEVNAFGRLGSTEEDFAASRDEVPATRALIYAMSSTDSTTLREVPVKLLSEAASVENLSTGSTSVVDQSGNTLYIPNDMVSAGVWFAAGYNKHELHVNVTDGTLKLGIKKAQSDTYHWVIMDNWKLFYLGGNSAYGIENVELAADGDVVSVAVYNANGVQLNGLQKGVNIIRTVYSNGAVTVKKVIK